MQIVFLVGVYSCYDKWSFLTLKFTNSFNIILKLIFTSFDRLSLLSGEYANATLTITPTAGTESGTDVTLTIEAKSSNGIDSNYAVLRLSVVNKVRWHILIRLSKKTW